MVFTVSLKKPQDFRHCYRKGKSKADFFFVVYVLKNNQETNRLGISISKKVGNSVVRHRVKRLVKESYRLQEHFVKRGHDIVFIARGPAKDVDFSQVNHSLENLFKKHHIWNRECYDEKNSY